MKNGYYQSQIFNFVSFYAEIKLFLGHFFGSLGPQNHYFRKFPERNDHLYFFPMWRRSLYNMLDLRRIAPKKNTGGQIFRVI